MLVFERGFLIRGGMFVRVDRVERMGIEAVAFLYKIWWGFFGID